MEACGKPLTPEPAAAPGTGVVDLGISVGLMLGDAFREAEWYGDPVVG
jgi:hypothetical protein